MNLINKINTFFEKKIPLIITIYFFIQPIIDLIAGICINVFEITNIFSALIRILFFLFCLYYLFFIDKDKKKKYYLLLFILYIIIFFINIIFMKDVSVIFYEFQNTISTFYFPVVFISLLSMFKKYNFNISYKQILYIVLTYLLLIIIPNLLGISTNSYAHSKEGTIGLFTSANAIGGILSICFPCILIYFKDKKNIYFLSIFLILFLYILLNIGTKTPVLCAFMIILLNLIYFIIYKKNMRKILVPLIVIFLMISIYLIPKTSFYKNIEIHLKFLGVNNILEIFKDETLIDHFIFSQRLTFLNRTRNSYINSNISSKILGIGYIENYGTDNMNLKTIEMDYYDIYYRHGIFGILLIFYPLFMFFKELVSKESKFSFEKYNIIISILLIFILAFFSGHIFVTPQVSIFVCLIFNYYKNIKNNS